MSKIKVEKQMTLPELLVWAWKKGVKNKVFYSEVTGTCVTFDEVGTADVKPEIYELDSFTVEYEEDKAE